MVKCMHYSWLVRRCCPLLVNHWRANPRGAPPNIPGWNEYAAERKEWALFWHLLWKDMGKPQHGYNTEKHNISGAQYHYTDNLLKKNENALQSEKYGRVYYYG